MKLSKLTAIAIVPTACGIETITFVDLFNLFKIIAIVPTACGIETTLNGRRGSHSSPLIAIVPTACGIET